MELHGRRYFHLSLRDSDALLPGAPRASLPLTGEPFAVRLSAEHTGLKFARGGLLAAASEVTLHSGGWNSTALRRIAEVEAGTARTTGAGSIQSRNVASEAAAGGVERTVPGLREGELLGEPSAEAGCRSCCETM